MLKVHQSGYLALMPRAQQDLVRVRLVSYADDPECLRSPHTCYQPPARGVHGCRLTGEWHDYTDLINLAGDVGPSRRSSCARDSERQLAATSAGHDLHIYFIRSVFFRNINLVNYNVMWKT